MSLKRTPARLQDEVDTVLARSGRDYSYARRVSWDDVAAAIRSLSEQIRPKTMSDLVEGVHDLNAAIAEATTAARKRRILREYMT